MKRKMQGLLWLFLLEFALMVMSLEPGFLDFDNLPDTNFSCVGKVIGGYYADLETNCQMFHVCTIGQLDEPMDIRFLCLNGTVFDQETRVCERIDEVDCSKSEQFYSLNLELYGNTQPPILEESPEVEYPSDSRKTSTTVPPTSSTATSTFAPFFLNTPPTTTIRDISKIITSHHFPVNSPDIRFNPEEINISLKAGAPPDITRSQVPISYQQQTFSEKNTRVTVTTHTTIYKSEKHNRSPILSTTNPPIQSFTEKAETTLTPKSVVSYGLTHNKGSASIPSEINYGFSFPQTEESIEYHTDVPPHPYQYQLSINNFRPPSAQGHPYHSSYRNSNRRQPKSNFPATTYRNHPAFTSSPKAPVAHRYQSQTEKPPNLQLPLPLLPTLPPLSFSSPSPFSLGHHIETKRYTKDHQSAPRIIISASASVSDNNGRRLNYSLGTIGASHFLGSSPASYDDYKEEDVILDPFYHDVPKLKKTRRRRNIVDNDDVIRDEKEAEDLLRYLFNWYKKKEKTERILMAVSAEDITNINHQLAPLADIEATSSSEINYNEMFRRILNTTINGIVTSTTAPLVNNGHGNETSMNNTDELHLTSKNHTRRSGLLQDVDYSGDLEEQLLQYSQNLSNEIQKHQKLTNTTEYLDEYFNEENATVLQHLGETQNKTIDEYLEELQENVTTITDIPAESTTAKNVTIVPVSDYYYYSENDDYYDYPNPGVESEANISTSNNRMIMTTERPMNVSDYFELYGNDTLYENLEFERTTTDSPDVDVTMLPVPTTVEEVQNSTEESQAPDQEKYSSAKVNVLDLTNEKESTDKFEAVQEEVSTEPVTKSEEFPMFAISDYVDDNYEALTYPIHPQMNGGSGGLTTTPQYDSLTSNFKEIEPSTELEKLVTIDLPKSASEPSVTVQTDLPTTLSPETTIVTEGAIQFSTETISTETITEATRVTSISPTDTITGVTTEMKEDEKPNRIDYSSRHRFGSINRMRGRGRSNFQTEPEPVLNTVNNTTNNTESSTISYFSSEASTTGTIPKLETTTLATERKVETAPDFNTETPITDAPLLKSANPTKAKYSRIILSTTPLTKVVRVDLKNDFNQLRYSFNCFNKYIHRFYSDPRDCRLFHYCTLGYTKNQLVDMKFVCDLGTYYDEEKFLCTKEKPARCL